jgi:cell division septation protein DedD
MGLKRAIVLIALALLLLVSARSSPAQDRDDAAKSAVFFLVPDALYARYFPLGDKYAVPDDPKTADLVRRARSLEERKNWQAAAETYGLACKRAAGSPAAPYLRFKECVLLADLELSIAGLKDLIGTYPAFPLADAVRFELAKRSFAKKDYGTAQTALREIVQRSSEGEGQSAELEPYAQAFLGELTYRMGRPNEAIQHYMASIETAGPAYAEGLEEFFVKNYLEASRALIAVGGAQSVSTAAELLRRIAGSSSSPLFREEALSMYGELARLRGEGASGGAVAKVAPLQDDALLSGSYRLTPDLALVLPDGTRGGREAPPEEGYTGDERAVPNPSGGAHDTAAVSAAGSYSVQVGSFGRRENAETLASELGGKGYRAFVREASVEGKTVYRVRVGPFAAPGDAEAARKGLDSLGYRGFVFSER